MLVISVAIRLESRGSILFCQELVGVNGHIFEMLKFRTMVPEAENLRNLVEHLNESGQLIHKTSDDPRVTRGGRLLRRTSLDKLPQMLNVFRGEMSLVGPHSEMPYLVEKYKLWQRARFAVPQGITGWWQIQGRRDIPMHLNTDDVLYYLQNYSLLLDIYS
jgi:lipopolysaccharide/colanic/teichoic acid biosynthesis glycosyltransferase